LIQGLSQIGEDENPGDGDGLFVYLSRIIESKQPEPVSHFQYWHGFIAKNIVSTRYKKDPVPIGTGRTDFDNEEGTNPAAPDEFAVGSEGDADHARRHVETRTAIERKQSRFENIPQILDLFKKTLREEIEKAEQICEFVITQMKQRQAFEEEKDETSNDSDRLLVFFPEALRLYCRSAYDQIEILVQTQNMRQDTNGEIIFKDGRPEVRLVLNEDQTVSIKNLFSLVSLESLDANLRAMVENKKRVRVLRKRGMTARQIAKEIGESREFVDDTFRLFEVFETASDGLRKRPNTKGKVARYNTDVVAWLNDLTASRLKNSFAWVWGVILSILYKPTKYAVTGKKKDDEDIRLYWETQRIRLAEPSPEWDGTMPVLSKKTNRPFLKRIYARGRRDRVYKHLDPSQLQAFVSLFPVHPYILEGTLPDRFYGKVGSRSPVRKKGKRVCEESPGCAWGHNICRRTNESNCRMFYEIFMGGLDRNNPKHKVIRMRAARVWLLRRVLRRLNRKVQKPRRKRNVDANTEAEYRRAMAMYKWCLHLKKTSPAWKRELERRWSLDPTSEWSAGIGSVDSLTKARS
jgi:hypothetical protein